MEDVDGATAPGAGQFAEKMREGGLKAAPDWRDGAFRREGFD